MIIRLFWLAAAAGLLAGCTQHAARQPSVSVCQGYGCSKEPGKLPDRAETHKTTKDEKIRARRGEDPRFGSEEMRIGGSIPLAF